MELTLERGKTVNESNKVISERHVCIKVNKSHLNKIENTTGGRLLKKLQVKFIFF